MDTKYTFLFKDACEQVTLNDSTVQEFETELATSVLKVLPGAPVDKYGTSCVPDVSRRQARSISGIASTLEIKDASSEMGRRLADAVAKGQISSNVGKSVFICYTFLPKSAPFIYVFYVGKPVDKVDEKDLANLLVGQLASQLNIAGDRASLLNYTLAPVGSTGLHAYTLQFSIRYDTVSQLSAAKTMAANLAAITNVTATVAGYSVSDQQSMVATKGTASTTVKADPGSSSSTGLDSWVLAAIFIVAALLILCLGVVVYQKTRNQHQLAVHRASLQFEAYHADKKNPNEPNQTDWWEANGGPEAKRSTKKKPGTNTQERANAGFENSHYYPKVSGGGAGAGDTWLGASGAAMWDGKQGSEHGSAGGGVLVNDFATNEEHIATNDAFLENSSGVQRTDAYVSVRGQHATLLPNTSSPLNSTAGYISVHDRSNVTKRPSLDMDDDFNVTVAALAGSPMAGQPSTNAADEFDVATSAIQRRQRPSLILTQKRQHAINKFESVAENQHGSPAYDTAQQSGAVYDTAANVGAVYDTANNVRAQVMFSPNQSLNVDEQLQGTAAADDDFAVHYAASDAGGDFFDEFSEDDEPQLLS